MARYVGWLASWSTTLARVRLGFQLKSTPSSPPAWGQDDWKRGRRRSKDPKQFRDCSDLRHIFQQGAWHCPVCRPRPMPHVSFSIFCIFTKAGVPMPISSLQPFCRMDSRAYVTPALLGLRMLKDFWRDPGSQPFASLVCWCLLTAATKTSALRHERHLDINEEQKALIRFHVWSIAIALAISSWCEAQTTMGWSWVCVFSFSVS